MGHLKFVQRDSTVVVTLESNKLFIKQISATSPEQTRMNKVRQNYNRICCRTEDILHNINRTYKTYFKTTFCSNPRLITRQVKLHFHEHVPNSETPTYNHTIIIPALIMIPNLPQTKHRSVVRKLF